MKYYAIRILENQYNVLEVDGSDKIGMYQVDESIVHQMHEQSKQKKLDLVIQEANGTVLYMGFPIIFNLLFYQKAIMFLLAIVNMFLTFFIYFLDEYRFLNITLLIILNFGVIYLYYLFLRKEKESYFYIKLLRNEIQGRGGLRKGKQFIKSRIINLGFLFILCCFLILIKETKVFPWINSAMILLFCNLIVVSFDYFFLWSKFSERELYNNYRGVQPILQNNVLIEWHENKEIQKKEIPKDIQFIR